jgi:hypothetical protein
VVGCTVHSAHGSQRGRAAHAGKIRVEDAGFDWKLLGPDVHDVSYVAWQCDQDAYACSGQKCSAQSMLFMHRNWRHTQLLAQVGSMPSPSDSLKPLS